MKNLRKYVSVVLFVFSCFVGFSGNVFAQEEVYGEIINVNKKYKIAFTDLSSMDLKKGDIVEIYQEGHFITHLEVAETSSAISKLIPSRRKGKFAMRMEFQDLQVGSQVVKIFTVEEKKRKVSEERKAEKSRLVQEVSEKNSGITLDVSISEEGSAMPDGVVSANRQQAFDQFQKLSGNYLTLTNNLAELLNEKKILDAEHEQLSLDFKLAKEKIKKLELQNSLLKHENQQLQDVQKKDKSQVEIKKLQKTIVHLKVKLKKIVELLERKKRSYEN